MLSDAEQRRLAEIETGLQRDDPAFVERFAGRGARTGLRRGMTPRVWLLAAVVASGVAWLLESAVVALIALSAFSVGMSLWSLPAGYDDGRPPRGR
jgi:hypothetical protein